MHQTKYKNRTSKHMTTTKWNKLCIVVYVVIVGMKQLSLCYKESCSTHHLAHWELYVTRQHCGYTVVWRSIYNPCALQSVPGCPSLVEITSPLSSSALLYTVRLSSLFHCFLKRFQIFWVNRCSAVTMTEIEGPLTLRCISRGIHCDHVSIQHFIT